MLNPKLSSLINDRSIIFNLSHHVRFSNNYNETFQFNDAMNVCLSQRLLVLIEKVNVTALGPTVLIFR